MDNYSTALPLPDDLVKLGASPTDKTAAIREVGQLLADGGFVDPEYVESMLRRENTANTFLGSGVAIPHGEVKDKGLVKHDAIAVLQIPSGLEWNPGEMVRLVVGIAANSDSHISILRRLTRLIQNEERMAHLGTTGQAEDIIKALSEDAAATTGAGEPASDFSEKFDWVLDYPTGLHARPASMWVEAAKSTSASLRIRHGQEMADPRNLISLLQLGLKCGDQLSISSSGKEAEAALANFKRVISGLSAQEKAEAAEAAKKAAAVPQSGWLPPSGSPGLAGLSASPGLTFGMSYLLKNAETAIADQPVPLAEGAKLLEDALKFTRQQMAAMVDDANRRLGASEAGIFKAQAGLLDDVELITLACRQMALGHGAAWSWNAAVEDLAGKLSALDNQVLAARAADLRDVGRRVLAKLDPSSAGGGLNEMPNGENLVILAEDLSPSDTANLDPAKTAALVTALGGPTSHTAILARTLGLPAVVAAGKEALTAADGTVVIVDGNSGRLWFNPSKEDLAAAKQEMARLAEKRIAIESERAQPARTQDGHEMEIGANINLASQVPLALGQGADGVGLMRTEFLFLESDHAPSEDEQFAAYRDMLKALGGRPLIVRALDIGGDKQVPHLRLPVENNPFLGVRGARLLLRRQELLMPQLKALYRAAKEADGLSIMFPMITSLAELKVLKARCEEVRAELKAPKVPLGIMVEVPSAAVMADMLAAEADFFSIGTNDLTQYVLAIDRQNPELAAEADSLNPAVLRLISRTVEGAAKFGRWVGVCGGLAGEPSGAMLLSGLGVNELSMTPRDIPAVKAALRGGRQADFKELAQRALTLSDAGEIKALMAGVFGEKEKT